MAKKRILELRAENIKGLEEQRADLVEEMDKLLGQAKEEKRAMSADEDKKFNDLKEKIAAIDKTLKAEEERAALENVKASEKKDPKEDVAKAEERAFADYIRGKVSEIRAGEQNLTMGNNGAVIPATIANRIIKTVKDMSPVLSRATVYSVKGTLKIPVWGYANTSHDISVGYQTEFTEITADAGKFTSIDLGGYLAGALTLLGKSVINNAQVDVVSFVVNEMAEKIALFIEGELLKGSGSSAAQGICTGATNTLTAASATAVTADELIELQSKVKQVYQQDACWIMSSKTFTALKKLKDSNGRYLLQDNVQNEFPYMLLGKPIFLSDNMADMAASAKSVIYGDLSGLSVNFRENIEIQLLQEVYAAKHAVGVVAWFEFDSKVTDNQKLAVLVQKAS